MFWDGDWSGYFKMLKESDRLPKTLRTVMQKASLTLPDIYCDYYYLADR